MGITGDWCCVWYCIYKPIRIKINSNFSNNIILHISIKIKKSTKGNTCFKCNKKLCECIELLLTIEVPEHSVTRDTEAVIIAEAIADILK